jgi:hypothetical protein
MHGDSDSAVGQIDSLLAASPESIVGLDRLALLLLKAEILYLDCRETEALEVFKSAIDSQLETFPQEIKFVVAQNRRDVAFTLLDADGFRQADRLYDQRQLAGIKFWDPQALVYAYEAAASGRHYEALPAIWRELTKSYRQGSWQYRRQASRRMANEFLQLGWGHSADYHAIAAQDSELVKLIGDHLLAWRQPLLVEQLVQRLLANANLKRHAIVACELLVRITDAIPDNQINAVVEWLLPLCSTNHAKGRSAMRLAKSAWEATQSIAYRLNAKQAKEVVRLATQHPSWMVEDHLRKHIIQTVDDCLDSLPPEDLPELVLKALPLATGLSGELNYDKDVLYLLRHLASRGDADIKKQIGDVLYPNSPVNFELIRIAEEFGKQIDEQEATRIAEYYAQDVRLQVQHLAHDEEFKKPAISLGAFTSTNGEERVAVSIYSDMGLKAVAAHRRLLRPETVQLFVEALLDMIQEPENTPANKVSLINCIITLADVIGPELAEIVYEALAPIAAGEVSFIDVTGATGDPNHPLNPFKVDLGSPATVQGGALYALACIEASREGVYGQRFTKLLEQAATNSSSEVRKIAFEAARRVPRLPENLVMTVLMGTRDIDPNVAEAAFLGISRHTIDKEEFWHSLVYALILASDSPNLSVRKSAAFTVSTLRTQAPSEEILNKLAALHETLKRDISYSVRSQIFEPASD